MPQHGFTEITGKHGFDPVVKQHIKALCRYDNVQGIFALLSDYLVIAVAVYLTRISAWLYPLTLLLIGSRQRALATLLHEAAHACSSPATVRNL